MTGNTSTEVEATASGLSPDTKYVYRVVATNAGGLTTGTPDQAAATLPEPPAVTTDPEGTLAQTSAVLNGHVVNEAAPLGSACSFQVTLASDPTFASPVATANCSAPNATVTGDTSTAVTAKVTILAPATEYIYRARATSAGNLPPGSFSNGVAEPFTTLPNAPAVTTTAGASEITQTTAKVAGTVNPNKGNVTVCKVEYGLTTGYGSQQPCASLPGSGSTPVAVSGSLSGLAANKTYHFRVVASNGGGTTNGTDKTFATQVEAPAVTTSPGATGISQAAATVSGAATRNGGNVTACKVEYGAGAGYGAQASCASLPGAGTSPVAVSAALSGLSAARPTTSASWQPTARARPTAKTRSSLWSAGHLRDQSLALPAARPRPGTHTHSGTQATEVQEGLQEGKGPRQDGLQKDQEAPQEGGEVTDAGAPARTGVQHCPRGSWSPPWPSLSPRPRRSTSASRSAPSAAPASRA